MAQPMFFIDGRAARDAAKWGRWSWQRRLLKRVMNPERAAEMRTAHAQVAYLQAVAVQPARKPDPAWWRASSLIRGL